MNNNPSAIIAALNVENRQLRQQLGALSHRRSMQQLFDQLVCAALTGAMQRLDSPTDAAELAVQATNATLAALQKESAPAEEKPSE